MMKHMKAAKKAMHRAPHHMRRAMMHHPMHHRMAMHHPMHHKMMMHHRMAMRPHAMSRRGRRAGDNMANQLNREELNRIQGSSAPPSGPPGAMPPK